MGLSAPERTSKFHILLLYLLIFGKTAAGEASVTPLPAGEEVTVSTGEEFLAALSNNDVSVIGMQGSITLTEADVEPYSLPIKLVSKRILLITTAGLAHSRDGDWQTLVLGEILDLLYLESGSELCFKNIRVKGTAPPSTATSSIEVRGSPIWPTITGDTDHKVVFENMWVEKVQQGCTPELAAVQVNIFRQLLGRNDSVTYVGTTLTIADTLVAPSPLTNRFTKLQEGLAEYTYSFVVVNCKLDPAAIQTNPPPAPSPPPSDSLVQISVRSVTQLVSALGQAAQNMRLTLEDSIFLSDQAAAGYDLPFVRDPGSTLTFASGSGSPRVIDLGGMLTFLFLQPGATVKFERLSLQGAAPASLGLANAQEVPIYIQGGPFWPTINGAPYHNVTFVDCQLQAVRTNCTPEYMSAKANAFDAMVSPGGSVAHRDLSITVDGSVSVPYPIFNEALQLGMATYRWVDSSLMCVNDSGNNPVPSSPTSSSSNAALIGGLVGGLVGGALVIALAVGAVMWRRRKAQRTAAAQHDGATPFKLGHDPSVHSVKLPGSSGGKGSTQDLSRASSSHLLIMQSGDLEGGVPYARRGGQGGSGEDVNTMGAKMWNTRVGVIEGLDLGELLGRGSFGRAYRGRWKGAIVAVKIVEQCIQHGKSYDLSREPLLSMSVSHPNVVMTYKLSVVCVKPNPPSITDSAKESFRGSGKGFSGRSLLAAAVSGGGSQGGGAELGGSGSTATAAAAARSSDGSGKGGGSGGGSSGGSRPPSHPPYPPTSKSVP